MAQFSFDFLDRDDQDSADPASTTPPRKVAATSRTRAKRTRRDAVVSVTSPVVTSADAFLSPAPLSLSDIKAKAEADTSLTATQRRDMVSGLARIEKVFATPLDEIEASPRRLRTLFAARSAAQLGLSEKSFANIRSLAIQALSRYGAPDLPVTRRFAMTPAWRERLDRIEKPYNRQSLHRLAIYCSRTGLLAEDVTPQTLIGFREALEAEEVVKDPGEIVSNTISKWNGALRDVLGWPQQKLCEPNKEIPLARPLGDFPASFQADVATWYGKMSDPDPLDEDAPVKPLRPATLAHRLYTFRSFASALVACGHYSLTEITSLGALLQPDAFKAGIRFFHERNGGKTLRIHNMARNLRLIGKNHCRFDAATLAQLEAICRRLDAGKRHQMTDRNRKRLAQFDDPANVARLLRFPEREEAWALLQAPGAYLSVSRVLGHTSLDTTMAHYLGTESKAAGRHLDRLLTDTKADIKNVRPNNRNRQGERTRGGTA